MKNRDIYQRDPDTIALLNNGVATMTDAVTDDERRTLRFELEHFVCEGQYRSGLVRILDSYANNQGQTEQPAAWISGFFGSGKSHLAKMLRFLWTDYRFPEDGATARGLARLPDDVRDLLTEVSTLGRRGDGLCAAAGTLGAGAGDSVRLALLGIVFKAAGLPESYPQARFCLWLMKNGIYDGVRSEIEAEGRDFRRELNDLYVSPLIARALLAVDPHFAPSERDARATLRAQFPKPADVTTEDFIVSMQDALAPGEGMPSTVIILDEVQQYIGDEMRRSYVVQEVVETCSKQFADRVLFVGTGQTALTGTAALQRLQGRFTVNVELSDNDVETVIRRVVLAKRPDRTDEIQATLDGSSGEVDRHLRDTAICARTEDKATLVDDYPLLPVRRRFWEHTLRTVDRQGTAGQLRTQLRIVYDAILHTAEDPVGTVVAADFLFDELEGNLLQSGVLLREVYETIVTLRNDGTADGRLKSRLCALVFLIRKLPRDAGGDIGVRATTEALADLMVRDLTQDGAALRARLPGLLEELVSAGTLMKLDDEYGLQTRESSDWESEFRSRRNRLASDLASAGSKRSQLLGQAVQAAIGRQRLVHGDCKEPRRLALHFGADAPPSGNRDIHLWVRDGWGTDESTALADARAAGPDSPTIHVFIPKSRADALARLIATLDAATETLEYKGVPATAEGKEARQGMETRRADAENNLRALVGHIIDRAKVFQGGGNERLESALPKKVEEAANASLARLFYEFDAAADPRWGRVIERARGGAEHPLEAVDYRGKTEDHPVCTAVLTWVGAGKRGRDVRSHFSDPPFGWPRDAIDGALISLFETGQLRATTNGVALSPRGLDQSKVPTTDFRAETATISARQRLQARKLFQDAGIDCKRNEEVAAAGHFLAKLAELAATAGGAAPLPEPPDTRHLTELQSLVGNEQLVSVLDHSAELADNIKTWTRARELAGRRLPAFQRLQALLRHADGLDAPADVELQTAAIVKGRRLLDPSDPIPPLAARLADALRVALAHAQKSYGETYESESQRLANTENWQRIEQKNRDAILQRLHIELAPSEDTGTEEEIIATLDRVPLDGWRTRTLALPQLFAHARVAADKLVEPKIRHVKLEGATLRTLDDVAAWIDRTNKDLLNQVKQGPIAIG